MTLILRRALIRFWGFYFSICPLVCIFVSYFLMNGLRLCFPDKNGIEMTTYPSQCITSHTLWCWYSTFLVMLTLMACASWFLHGSLPQNYCHSLCSYEITCVYALKLYYFLSSYFSTYFNIHQWMLYLLIIMVIFTK